MNISFSLQNMRHVIGLVIICLLCLEARASNQDPKLVVKPFNSRIWKQSLSPRARQQERQGMLKDLTSNNKLVGLSEKELVVLLGHSDESRPEHTYQGKGANGKEKWQEWQYVYNSGYCGHDSIRLLLVRIENSKVAEYHVVDQDVTSYENTDKYVDPGMNPKGSLPAL